MLVCLKQEVEIPLHLEVKSLEAFHHHWHQIFSHCLLMEIYAFNLINDLTIILIRVMDLKGIIWLKGAAQKIILIEIAWLPPGPIVDVLWIYPQRKAKIPIWNDTTQFNQLRSWKTCI